jgi:hypothetical protein
MMLLEKRLSELREGARERIPARVREEMHRATEELRASGILAKALKVGDKMPAFELPNMNGEAVGSNGLLKQGRLVITFYRGVW